jgi:hypothetical protein
VDVLRDTRRRSSIGIAAACGAALALSLVGCVPRPLALPGREADPRELPGRGPGGTTTKVQDNALASKPVAGKEPPSTLIAEDGSRCLVPDRAYRETRIGAHVLCAWRTGSRTP